VNLRRVVGVASWLDLPLEAVQCSARGGPGAAECHVGLHRVAWIGIRTGIRAASPAVKQHPDKPVISRWGGRESNPDGGSPQRSLSGTCDVFVGGDGLRMRG